MIQCASVRKRGATDQCPSAALRGLTLCGKHVRARDVVLWTKANRHRDVRCIQALVRGWLIRKRLRIAGPGVLSRKDLSNDDEPFHYETKETCNPLTYFAFEENGKTWWFHSHGLWKWCVRSHEPTNPYTRTPLAPETRTRLRELWVSQGRWATWSESYEDRVEERWNVICQIFADYGFLDVHPRAFLDLDHRDILSMFVLLHQDLRTVLHEKNPFRNRILHLCRLGMTPQETSGRYLRRATYVLLMMLTMPKDAYVIVFSALSALYRC